MATRIIKDLSGNAFEQNTETGAICTIDSAELRVLSPHEQLLQDISFEFLAASSSLRRAESLMQKFLLENHPPLTKATSPLLFEAGNFRVAAS